MRRLDEASAIAAAEELRFPLSQGWALGYLIAACDGVGDLPRATQWCMVMRDVAERWGARQLIGVCRSTYGRVLATSGDWVRAEDELVEHSPLAERGARFVVHPLALWEDPADDARAIAWARGFRELMAPYRHRRRVPELPRRRGRRARARRRSAPTTRGSRA